MKNSEYLSAADLEDRWQIQNYDLLKMVKEERIKWFMEEDFFSSSTERPSDAFCRKMKWQVEKEYRTREFLLGNLNYVFFKKSDIEAFEEKNPKYKPQDVEEKHLLPAKHVSKQHQQAKERCREVAETLLKINPKIQIAEAIFHDEMNEAAKKPDGSLYTEKAIRGWIKDSFPADARKPGRRPKT